jgi:hypothetical protein
MTKKVKAALEHVNQGRRKFLGMLLVGAAAAPILRTTALAATGSQQPHAGNNVKGSNLKANASSQSQKMKYPGPSGNTANQLKANSSGFKANNANQLKANSSGFKANNANQLKANSSGFKANNANQLKANSSGFKANNANQLKANSSGFKANNANQLKANSSGFKANNANQSLKVKSTTPTPQ